MTTSGSLEIPNLETHHFREAKFRPLGTPHHHQPTTTIYRRSQNTSWGREVAAQLGATLMEDSTSKEITWMDGGWWEDIDLVEKIPGSLGDLFGRKKIHTTQLNMGMIS